MSGALLAERCTRSPWPAWQSTRTTGRTPWGRLRRTAGLRRAPPPSARWRRPSEAIAAGPAGPPPRAGHRSRRAALLGRGSRPGDVHSRGGGVRASSAASRRYGTAARHPGHEARPLLRRRWPRVALALGATWAPRSSLEVESYLTADAARAPRRSTRLSQARDWLLRGVARRPTERAALHAAPGGRRRRAAARGPAPSSASRCARPLDLVVDDAAVITPLTRAPGGSPALRGGPAVVSGPGRCPPALARRSSSRRDAPGRRPRLLGLQVDHVLAGAQARWEGTSWARWRRPADAAGAARGCRRCTP